MKWQHIIDLALKRPEFFTRTMIVYIEKDGIPDKEHAHIVLIALSLAPLSHASHERARRLAPITADTDRVSARLWLGVAANTAAAGRPLRYPALSLHKKFSFTGVLGQTHQIGRPTILCSHCFSFFFFSTVL